MINAFAVVILALGVLAAAWLGLRLTAAAEQRIYQLNVESEQIRRQVGTAPSDKRSAYLICLLAARDRPNTDEYNLCKDLLN